MDDVDRKILKALQEDASGSVASIAERAGVSQTPCWKRIKRLEEAGVIRRRVALVDNDQVGLKLTGYVRIRAGQHSDEWVEKFATAVQRIPEIIECHRMTGEVDYLLKVVAPDMEGYDRIYKSLIDAVDMSDVSVGFSMERLKETTEVPLTYAE